MRELIGFLCVLLRNTGNSQAAGEHTTFGMDEPWGDGTWGKYPDKQEQGAVGTSGLSLSAAAAAAAGISPMNTLLYQKIRSINVRNTNNSEYAKVRILLSLAPVSEFRRCSTYGRLPGIANTCGQVRPELAPWTQQVSSAMERRFALETFEIPERNLLNTLTHMSTCPADVPEGEVGRVDVIFTWWDILTKPGGCRQHCSRPRVFRRNYCVRRRHGGKRLQ